MQENHDEFMTLIMSIILQLIDSFFVAMVIQEKRAGLSQTH